MAPKESKLIVRIAICLTAIQLFTSFGAMAEQTLQVKTFADSKAQAITARDLLSPKDKLEIPTRSESLKAFGGGSTGGGGAYVWRDLNTGKIVKAELIDLYIYANDSIYQMTYQKSSEPEAAQMEQLLKVQNKLNETDIVRALKLVSRDMNFLNLGVKIPLAPDVTQFSGDTPELSPDPGYCKQQGQSCGPEMIAYYDSRGKLQVNPEVYGALEETQKLAFKVHEAIYKLYRVIRGDIDAQNTRLAVAKFFSSDPRSHWIYDSQFPVLAELTRPKFEEQAAPTPISAEVIDLVFGDKTLTCKPKNTDANFKDTIQRRVGTTDFLGKTIPTILYNNSGDTHAQVSIVWPKVSPIQPEPELFATDNAFIEISDAFHWSSSKLQIYAQDILRPEAYNSARPIRAFYSSEYSYENPDEDHISNGTSQLEMVCTLK